MERPLKDQLTPTLFKFLYALFVVTIAALATAGCQLVVRPPATPQAAPAAAFVFTAAGDYGLDPDAAATLAGIGRAGANFHLALGDLSYRGPGSETTWCALVKSKVGAALPVQLVAGNHEDDSGEDGHIARFIDCLPDRIGVTGAYGAEYFFDYLSLARVILISPDLTINGENYYYGDGNRHYRWIADTIDSARAKGIPWVIVGMHKNCISVGVYYCNIYQDLMDLLVQKRVDLVLTGHDHTYQRSKQIGHGPACPTVTVDEFNRGCVVDDGQDNVYTKGKGAVFVVVGTGGAPLYEVNPQDPEAGYFVKWMGANSQPRKGFIRFTVSATAISAQFVGTTPTSSFDDSFVIRAVQP